MVIVQYLSGETWKTQKIINNRIATSGCRFEPGAPEYESET
jgi:hypothetical protein